MSKASHCYDIFCLTSDSPDPFVLRAQADCCGLLLKHVLAKQKNLDTAKVCRLGDPSLTIVRNVTLLSPLSMQDSTMPLLSYLHQVRLLTLYCMTIMEITDVYHSAPKYWPVIYPEHYVEIQRFLKRWAAKFNFDPKTKTGLYLPPETIKAMKWSTDQFVQYQNEIIVTWPSTLYQSFSLGQNISEELGLV